MFGVDEIFEKLLNEARSIEDIQKLLINRYVRNGNVPRDIFIDIFNADPTKKKAYARWMLDKYGNESKLIDMIVSNEIAGSMFKYFQERAHGESPINLVDIPTVERAYSLLPEEIKGTEDNLLRKDGDGPENDFDVVYDTPEWKIVRPNTYEAAEKLGEGCKWCTSGAFRNGQHYFDDYTSSGPLWINLDYRDGGEIGWENGKEYPFKRYQFCFERNAYMDHHDDPIDFEKLDMPEEVIDFYGDEDSSYKKAIEEGGMDAETRFERYNDWRYEQCFMVCEINGDRLDILPEFNNNYEIEDDPDYYLYSTPDDDYDPIFYRDFRVDPSPIVFDGSETYMAVILKDTGDEYDGVYYGYELGDNRRSMTYQVVENTNYGFSFDDNVMWMYPENNKALFVFSRLTSNEWRAIETIDTIENVLLCNIVTPDMKTDPCVFIQVEYKSGSFGLFKESKDENAPLRCIVKSDYPKNGDEFTLSKITHQGEWPVIEGKLHTYSLFGEKLDKTGTVDNSDLSSYHIKRKLNDIVYIIGKTENEDSDDEWFNLYDVEAGEKLLPEDSRNIMQVGEMPIVAYASKPSEATSTIHPVNASFNGCSVKFFNYATRKSSMDFVRESYYYPYLFGVDKENSFYVLSQDMEILKTLPGYISVGKYDNNNAIFFNDGSGVHCCLVGNDLSIEIPNGVEKFTTIPQTDYAVVVMNNSQQSDIVNIKTWKTLVKGVEGWRPIKSYRHPDWENCVKYDVGDDKWNVLYNNKVLLPFYVDNIDEYITVPDRYIPFNKDGANYIYSLTDNTILPNKTGFRRVKEFGHFKNGPECYEVIIEIPNNVASTVYGIVHANFAPELNAIIYVETESQEIIDYVKTLYNYKPIDEPNQLTESFRNMMKRLNKVAF